MSQELYGVRYFKGDKLKQKEFESIDEARRFYERVSRKDAPAQLFRFWKETWVEALTTWTMEFGGHKILVVPFLGCCIVAGFVLGGLIWPLVK